MNADARIGLAEAGAVRASDLRPRPRSHNRVRGILRSLHKLLGLVVAVYVVIAAGTGAALMFRAEALGALHPQIGSPPADIVQQAERLAERLEPGSFTSIRFPDEALAAFVVYRPAHRTELFDPVTLQPIEDRFGANRAFDWLFDLHHYLLAGESGKVASGLLGIAVALLVVLGLWLWWPWRRVWHVRNAWPTRRSLAARLTSHATLSIVAAPALLLAALTGAGVVFHAQVRPFLIALLGEREAAVAVPERSVPLSVAAREVFPEARPRILIPPGQTASHSSLRVRQPAELHPNGRSSLVYDNASSMAVSASSEPLSGTGNRAFNLLYPLHTGVAGGMPLRILLFLAAILTVATAIMGLLAWTSRRSVRGRRASLVAR